MERVTVLFLAFETGKTDSLDADNFPPHTFSLFDLSAAQQSGSSLSFVSSPPSYFLFSLLVESKFFSLVSAVSGEKRPFFMFLSSPKPGAVLVEFPGPRHDDSCTPWISFPRRAIKACD